MFHQLPEELLVKIFDLCSEEDRKSLSLVCKRFLDIYRHKTSREYVFHLQGHTERLFRHGLSSLLNTNFVPFTQLKISKFNLPKAFDEKFPNDKDIFGKPLCDYTESSYACKHVTSLTLWECIVSDKSLIRLRRLFPHLNHLAILRTYFTKSSYNLLTIDKEKFKPIRELVITLPFLTDVKSNPTGLDWLIKYCIHVDKFETLKSEVSNKRPNARRFHRYKNDKKPYRPSNFQLGDEQVLRAVRVIQRDGQREIE